MKRIKLGIIGTGLAAKNLHLPALKKLKNKYEIIAVANRSKAKAEDFVKLIGNVSYYLDYKDLLKRNDIEAVLIAVPIDLNYKIAADSLKYDKHVILEKPLAASLSEADRLIKLEKESQLKAMVAENFYFKKAYRKVKKYIEEGRIGQPYAINWNLYYHVEEDKDYAATIWRQKHNYLGGFLLDAGVHNIAAIRMMLGEFKSGKAYKKSINPRIGAFDTMTFQFELENGVIGVYNLFFSVKGNWEDKLLIFGTEGTIEYQNNILKLKRERKKDIVNHYEDDHGFFEELNHFYDVLRKNKNVEYPFIEAKKDLEITLSAIKSADRKNEVTFK